MKALPACGALGNNTSSSNTAQFEEPLVRGRSLRLRFVLSSPCCVACFVSCKVEEELTKKNEGETKKMGGSEPYDMEGGGAISGPGVRRTTMATKLMTEVCGFISVAEQTRSLVLSVRLAGR